MHSRRKARVCGRLHERQCVGFAGVISYGRGLMIVVDLCLNYAWNLFQRLANRDGAGRASHVLNIQHRRLRGSGDCRDRGTEEYGAEEFSHRNSFHR